MKIALGCDHGGYELKEFIKKTLDKLGYEYEDFGCYSTESCDYPDFGHALAEGIASGEVYPGIGICGSGEGMSMTLNRHSGVRAGLAWMPEIAHLIRQHNNANVLVMPGRFVDNKTAEKIMDTFFATPFEGGRHERRVEKIDIHE